MGIVGVPDNIPAFQIADDILEGIHKGDVGHLVSVFRFHISVPEIFRLVHMSIGVNDFELLPYSLGSLAARYELTLFDLEQWCRVGASLFSKCFSGTG